MESFVLLLLMKNIKDSPKRLKKTPSVTKQILSRSASIYIMHTKPSARRLGLQGYTSSLAAEEIRDDGTVLTGSPCAYVPGLCPTQ